MRGIERLAAVKRSTPAMAKAIPELPMDQTVLVRLLRITVFGMSDFFEPVLRGAGLSEHSFHVLCLLVAAEHGAASPSELSELVGTTRGNMTRILTQLEQQGLAEREIQARDARRHSIKITAAGRDAVDSTVPQMIEPLLEGFGELNKDERAQLDRLLRKLILSFDKNARALGAVA
ncbi:MAG: MarR family transcriptional regulator [Salinisphaera sp.]|nr:MarR family transcriptional regulator [Salinisphaera sp.]